MTTTTPSARFSIAISRALGTVVVTVHGDLDVPGAGHLSSVLADLIDGQGNLAVMIDLHDASAVDASGVSVLASAAERARRRGGNLSLCDPAEVLYQALQLRGLGALVRTTRHDGQRRPPSAASGAARPRGWASHPATGSNSHTHQKGA
ncbi:MAG: STAS domain-containing protein [Acidimicrobiales bacterium]